MSTRISGPVISARVPHMVTVLVETKFRHPRYKKTITKSKKIQAQCLIEGVAEGDVVEIVACRPISKLKRHEVVAKIS